MFKSLSLFSAVPCPDRNKCSLINCIFSHELKTAPITLPPALAVDLEPPRNPSYRERSCDSTDSSLNGGVSLDSIAEEEANGQGRSKRRRVDERYGGSGSDSSAGGGGGGGVSLAAIAGPGVGDAKRTDAKKAKGVVPDVMTGIQLSQQKVSPSKKLAHKKTPLQQAPAAVASILDTALNSPSKAPAIPSTSGNRQLQMARALQQQQSITTSVRTPVPTLMNNSNVTSTTNSQSPSVSAPAKLVMLLPRPMLRAPSKPEHRTQLLKLLHTEYVRLYKGTAHDPDIMTIAIEEEATIATEKRAIYAHAIKNRISALKKIKVEDYAKQREELWKKRQSKERKEAAMLRGGGNVPSKVQKKPSSTDSVVAAGGSGGFGGLGGGFEPQPSGPSRLATASVDTTPVQTQSQEESWDPIPDSEPPKYTPIDTGLTAEEELEKVVELAATPVELTQYNYTTAPPSDKEIDDSRKGVEMSAGYEKCDRCESRFQVFLGRREEDGKLASGGRCTYHWGRAMFPPRSGPYNPAIHGGNEKVYNCCSESIAESQGCTSAEYHVFKVSCIKRLASQWQFVHTPEHPPSKMPGLKVKRAYCLDCEMCYTTLGMEIVRVTLTDWPSGDKVLDALVRPIGEIMDLNSRFSGVFSHQFADAKDFISMFNPSKFPKARNENITFIEQPNSSPLVLRIFPNPQTARSEIFKYLSPTTPLLGHALENDLNVLRIIHPTIIDTAILFPHSRGLPIKNKLKWLVERFLKWKIQVQEKTTPVGHDSAVDARCAGELVRYKVKQRFGPWIKEVPPGITGKEKAKEGKNNNLHGGLKEIKDDPPLGMKTKERKKPEIVRVPSPKMSQAQKQQVSFGMADTLRLLKEQAGGAGGTINKLISSLNPQQNPFTMTNPTVTAPIAKGLKRQREPGTDSDSAITTTANGKQPPKRAIKLPITPTSAAISKHKPNAPFQEDDDDNDNESDVPELDLLNNGVCLPEK